MTIFNSKLLVITRGYLYTAQTKGLTELVILFDLARRAVGWKKSFEPHPDLMAIGAIGAISRNINKPDVQTGLWTVTLH